VHIAINALSITNQSGTGRYAWGLIHGLMHPRHLGMRFTVFVPADFSIPAEWACEENICFHSISIRNTLHRILWEQFCLPGLCDALHVHVLHSPAFVSPVFRKPNARQIITVHDLAFRKYPQTIPRLRRWYYNRVIPASMRQAHLIFTDSYTVAEELRQCTDFSAKILPLPLAVHHLVFHPDERSDDLQILEHYGITKPYFLFVGTLEPRKNCSTLLYAYITAQARGLQSGLVIAGRLGWMQDRSRFQHAGVIETGFVPDAHLPALYRHAKALVAPSLYEGYDLPTLEASACGTPVIASDIPVHREVLGAYAVYVEVDNLLAWTQALLEAEDGRLIRNSAPIRTWTNVAEELYVTYVSMDEG
jgi:glycosyltransferase involved in cell wall biosynthesis